MNCQDPLQVIGRAKGYTKQELKDYLPRHSKFSSKLIQQIENLPDVFLRNSGSPLAKRLIQMMREISKEAYRAKQFTRTEINNRGVLYGIVRLEHQVIDIVLNYFHERWPQCVICLYNELNTKTHLINESGKIIELKLLLDIVVQKISENRPIISYFEDIPFSGKKIFETFYSTQNIKERENPRYFKKMIPNYCYELPGLKNGIEKRFNSRNETLDKFF